MQVCQEACCAMLIGPSARVSSKRGISMYDSASARISSEAESSSKSEV